MDIGAMIFEQANASNRAAVQHIAIGREQMARDVMAWVNRTGLHKFGDVPIGELVELLRKAGA